MATVKIRRTNDYINGIREYRLFIDGQKVGTIGNSQTKDFEISAGRHSIIAKIDWCSSKELSFEINDKDTITLLVGGLENWRWIMPLFSIFIVLSIILNHVPYYFTLLLILLPVFLILYYFTIRSKNYLTLKEL
jgi:hypothetical protein